MRYLHKNHKRMYLLVESEEDGQEAFRYMQRTYSGIQLVGLAKVSAEGRADDMLVNAINGIVSTVTGRFYSEKQESLGCKSMGRRRE